MWGAQGRRFQQCLGADELKTPIHARCDIPLGGTPRLAAPGLFLGISVRRSKTPAREIPFKLQQAVEATMTGQELYAALHQC
jgi:hypothetical protein